MPVLLPSDDATSVADASTLGPDGYKSLEGGPSEEDALATVLITDRQHVGYCTWFFLKKSEGEQNPGSVVVASPDRGVVSIPGMQSLKTPAGITMRSVKNDKGSTNEQIENAYDRYTVDKTKPVPIYTAPPRETPRHITSSP